MRGRPRPGPFVREDVAFESHGVERGVWSFRPNDAKRQHPCVILAHGFNGVRVSGSTPTRFDMSGEFRVMEANIAQGRLGRAYSMACADPGAPQFQGSEPCRIRRTTAAAVAAR